METPETSPRISEIRKRAASDAMDYLSKTPDTKILYKEILDPIAEKAYKELGIKTPSDEMELYLVTLVDAAGIKTE